MEKQCSLTSAVKGVLPLFNLNLSYHEQVIQTTLCVGVIILFQMHEGLRRQAEHFGEKNFTKCSHFFKYPENYDIIPNTQSTFSKIQKTSGILNVP